MINSGNAAANMLGAMLGARVAVVVPPFDEASSGGARAEHLHAFLSNSVYRFAIVISDERSRNPTRLEIEPRAADLPFLHENLPSRHIGK